MEQTYSRSGRLKRPTDKFQTYLQESSIKKKTKGEHHHDEDSSSKSKSCRDKRKSLKSYSCSVCGYTVLKRNAQDFIKDHHLKKHNKNCFDNGLVHCPNSSCNKPFLSDIDMERHCTMSDPSKTHCLRAYRDCKTMQMVNMRHASTQVDFSFNVSKPSTQQLGTKCGTIQSGTLYNTSFPSSHNIDTQDVAFPLSGHTMQGNFTSGSHFHNILIQHGGTGEFSKEHVEKAWLVAQHDITHPNESRIQNEEMFNAVDYDDDITLGNKAGTNVTHSASCGTDVLMNTQEKLEYASSNSCITRENKACIALEKIIRDAGAPLYLYDDIMKWAVKNKNNLPSRVPPMNRKKLYSALSEKFYQSELSKEKQRNIIRSHPDYRGKGIWFDWVDVVWEVEHDEEDNTSTITLPARVVMILDFQSATYEPIPDPILMLFPLLSQGLDNLLHRRRDGIQLLVHSASEEAEWDADVPNSIAERYSMEPFFQLIDFENIAGVVFVARDPPNHNNLDDMDYRITCVVHRTQWGSFFIPHLRRGYVAPNKSNFHLDEFNVDDNPW